MSAIRLSRSTAAVLIVDVQERLSAAMDAAALARTLRRIDALIEGARALELPLVLTEQYPKGLGPTVSTLAAHLSAAEKPLEKIRFSAWSDALRARLSGRSHVLVAGMETHVCVFQTVRDLAAQGFSPLVCADAVLSRTEQDRSVGLELCRDAGGTLVTVEAALFDLLEQAGSPEFKRISAAVR